MDKIRDERWEDMYARIANFTLDFDDQPIEFISLGMYVWWHGKYHWTEQQLVKEDLDLVDFNLLNWLLNEMVKIMDGYLAESEE